MKTLIMSLLLAINSFAFFEDFVDKQSLPNEQFILECQQDARLYEVNVKLLTEKQIKNNELGKLDTAVRKSQFLSMEYCQNLKYFNVKAKQVIEANRRK